MPGARFRLDALLSACSGRSGQIFSAGFRTMLSSASAALLGFFGSGSGTPRS